MLPLEPDDFIMAQAGKRSTIPVAKTHQSDQNIKVNATQFRRLGCGDFNIKWPNQGYSQDYLF